METVAHHSMIESKADMMGLQATSTKRKYDQTGLDGGNDHQKTENACNENGAAETIQSTIQTTQCTPAKTSRWSTMQLESTSVSSTCASSASSTTTTTSNSVIPSAEESIAKLEAVAMALPSMVMPLNSNINGNVVDGNVVDGNSIWRDSDSTRSTLATTLLSADLEDDDDFEEDDFDEDDSIIPCYSPLRYPCTTNMSARNGYMSGGAAYPPKPNYYSEPYPQQNCSRTPYNGSSQYGNRPIPMSPPHHPAYGGWSQHNPHHPNYYGPSPIEVGNEQQTIRCAENGKSYLELGSSNYMNGDSRHLKRCCDGRNGMWCNNNKQCYRERRLKMRNLSMFKLSRFRQISEQSLYRSVLICNTLKYIDREIEQENKDSATQQAEFHAQHHYTQLRLSNNNNNNNSCSDMLQQMQQQHHAQPPPQPPMSPAVSNRNPTWTNSIDTNNSPNVQQAPPPQQQQQQQQPQQQQQSNMNVLQAQQRPPQPQQQQQQPPPPPSQQTQHIPQQTPYSTTSDINSNNYLQPYNRTPTPIVTIMSFNETLRPYDHHPLRDCNGRATPFPGSLPDTDSGYGDEEKPINWSNVLSLSSQSALDPLINTNTDTNTSTNAENTTTITSLTSSSNSSLSSQQQQQQSPSSVVTTTTQFTSLTPVTPSLTNITTPSQPSWEYNFDMDLGLGAELTELLPMEPTKIVENEMDSLTALMVGGS